MAGQAVLCAVDTGFAIGAAGQALLFEHKICV
jgi:hypothetical protein